MTGFAGGTGCGRVLDRINRINKILSLGNLL
jgi:hypothetical protein